MSCDLTEEVPKISRARGIHQVRIPLGATIGVFWFWTDLLSKLHSAVTGFLLFKQVYTEFLHD